MDLSQLRPINQIQLHNYNKDLSNLLNLYNMKKLPNKMILSGSKGIGKATMAYHLINYIFSKSEDFQYNVNKFQINPSNKSFNLVNKNSHPNFHLIDVANDKKTIEISQVRKMIEYSNKSSFNNKEKIILIDNVEYLNQSSSNALLKIIEEPNENLFFILILDNKKNVLDTIKSRCIKFNFHMTFNESVDTTNKIINNDLYNFISKDLIDYYNKVGDFINLINFSSSSKINLSKISLEDFLINLINEKYYKKDSYIKNNIYKFIEFYLLRLTILNKSKNEMKSLYTNFINKIYYLKKFNLDEESFFIEFKSKVFNE